MSLLRSKGHATFRSKGYSEPGRIWQTRFGDEALDTREALDTHESDCRMLIVGSTLIIVAACAPVPRLEEDFPISSCKSGNQCTVSGQLQLHLGQPAWAALVVAGNECAKLALPDEFYAHAAKWKGANVVVTGNGFSQPDFAENGVAILWYSERDRKLSLGMCDGGIGVYVESMRATNGSRWPSIE